MPFVGKLVRSLVVAVVLASGVAWILAERTFPLTPAQLRTLRLWLSLGVGLESVALLLAVLRLSAPIRRAVGRGRAASEPAVVAAALAAHRLPSRVAALLAALGGTTTAALVATLRRQGLAVDLAFAGAALGVAATLLGTITGYSLTAAATARVTEDLGPRGDVGASGTLRGKILALALGLEVVILLFLGASGYARHRADVQREDVERTRQWIASAVASGSAELELPRQVVLATGASAAL